MPSRFEPCGLNQMYSLRYGTLPIVRATGGLVDTVANYDETTGGGTGFVFDDLSPDSLADTIGWASSTWYDRRDHIETMRQRAMAQDFSWDARRPRVRAALPGRLRAPARPRPRRPTLGGVDPFSDPLAPLPFRIPSPPSPSDPLAPSPSRSPRPPPLPIPSPPLPF